MAQQRRLTRAQKVLLDRIIRGNQPNIQEPVANIKTLADRGLIVLDGGQWQATVKAEEVFQCK